MSKKKITEADFIKIKKVLKLGMSNTECAELIGFSRDVVSRARGSETFEDYKATCNRFKEYREKLANAKKSDEPEKQISIEDIGNDESAADDKKEAVIQAADRRVEATMALTEAVKELTDSLNGFTKAAWCIVNMMKKEG